MDPELIAECLGALMVPSTDPDTEDSIRVANLATGVKLRLEMLKGQRDIALHVSLTKNGQTSSIGHLLVTQIQSVLVLLDQGTVIFAGSHLEMRIHADATFQVKGLK